MSLLFDESKVQSVINRPTLHQIIEILKNPSLAEEGFEEVLSQLSKAVFLEDMSYYRPLRGKDLIQRLEPHYQWKEILNETLIWLFEKTSTTPPLSTCKGVDDKGASFQGINFASQDYLSLSSHSSIKKAAIETIEEYGVHSAGSPALFGNTKFTIELERTIADFLQMDNVALFPTGWGAGFGGITALIRQKDHIVMDRLSHSCLREGAMAATRNLHYCPHLDINAVESKLQQIRAEDDKNAILVVTESLFSMDSDSPDLELLQAVCKKFDAWLLVDVAHDLGCLGENGLGVLEKQGMVGKVDFLIGSFSKTFASNGGFFAANSRALKGYFTFFSGPRAFSNALSPSQAAVILKAFEIVQSDEGDLLRKKLMDNVLYLRALLTKEGLPFKGDPSAIVPIIIGNEGLTRVLVRLLIERGVITNIVEFPGVAKGEARLRIQVMAEHTKQELDRLVDMVKVCLGEAQFLLSKLPKLEADKNLSSGLVI